MPAKFADDPAIAGPEPPDGDPRAAEILGIVAREVGIDVAALQPDATIEELGIASIDLTQALFELETKFDIEIPVVSDRTGAEFATVGDLVGHVIATIDRTHGAPPPGDPA
jgi:acyl carrier protein